ncbi:hypothetical protein ATSB10_25000 [Dyella thiooxydans]|uniref:DUF304 domain-containing protein n=1 Tax=Dyella thiooxydans TaxID=445710 RepID=A0A160N2U0_9GAMM|nr:hypothetical protein [Dyella thiooxydans]AND69954.1 hypothetical protein ATSB10_25000 [Dyella thiooxydans]
MQRLSSAGTIWYKRAFPLLWFGLLAVFLAIAWLQPGGPGKAPPRVMMIVPLFMMGFGYVLMRKLVFDLVDEVWLDGDQVVVVQRGERNRIPLLQVMNVNATTMVNPPRVTLMLRQPNTRLGDSVSFIPAGPRDLFRSFRPNPVALDLIRRIDDLRQRSP